MNSVRPRSSDGSPAETDRRNRRAREREYGRADENPHRRSAVDDARDDGGDRAGSGEVISRRSRPASARPAAAAAEKESEKLHHETPEEGLEHSSWPTLHSPTTRRRHS